MNPRHELVDEVDKVDSPPETPDPGPPLREAWTTRARSYAADVRKRLWTPPPACTARAREYVDRGSRATGVDPLVFVPATYGAVALAFLLGFTLFAWYTYRLDTRVFGTELVEGEWYRGIAYAEGKCVFIGALAAGVWIALGLFKKSWLAGGLLVAGAVGTFSAVVLLGLRSRLATTFGNILAEELQLRGFMQSNTFGRVADEALKSTNSEIRLPTGGPSWALAFAILLAMIVAGAFLLASLRRPPEIAALHRPDVPPLVQRYGPVIAAHAAALLIGIAFAVVRY